MYQLFFDLAALITACREAGAPLYIQSQRRTLRSAPIPLVETALVLTAPVPARAAHPPGGPTILAARLLVEQVQLWGLAGDQADHDALIRHVEAASDLLTTTLAAAGLTFQVDAGIVAEAGLLDDLRASHATHTLWRMEGADQADPRLRRLVPRSDL